MKRARTRSPSPAANSKRSLAHRRRQVTRSSLASSFSRAGRLITAFAIEGDFDPSRLRSNLFEMEWPPKSGSLQSFPEVDRAPWFTLEEAREKILPGQRPFIDRLLERLGQQHRA